VASFVLLGNPYLDHLQATNCLETAAKHSFIPMRNVKIMILVRFEFLFKRSVEFTTMMTACFTFQTSDPKDKVYRFKSMVRGSV
jgi:hypothetical protein